jgi:hypothetical protein
VVGGYDEDNFPTPVEGSLIFDRTNDIYRSCTSSGQYVPLNLLGYNPGPESNTSDISNLTVESNKMNSADTSENDTELRILIEDNSNNMLASYLLPYDSFDEYINYILILPNGKSNGPQDPQPLYGPHIWGHDIPELTDYQNKNIYSVPRNVVHKALFEFNAEEGRRYIPEYFLRPDIPYGGTTSSINTRMLLNADTSLDYAVDYQEEYFYFMVSDRADNFILTNPNKISVKVGGKTNYSSRKTIRYKNYQLKNNSELNLQFFITKNTDPAGEDKYGTAIATSLGYIYRSRSGVVGGSDRIGDTTFGRDLVEPLRNIFGSKLYYYKYSSSFKIAFMAPYVTEEVRDAMILEYTEDHKDHNITTNALAPDSRISVAEFSARFIPVNLFNLGLYDTLVRIEFNADNRLRVGLQNILCGNEGIQLQRVLLESYTDLLRCYGGTDKRNDIHYESLDDFVAGWEDYGILGISLLKRGMIFTPYTQIPDVWFDGTTSDQRSIIIEDTDKYASSFTVEDHTPKSSLTLHGPLGVEYNRSRTCLDLSRSNGVIALPIFTNTDALTQLNAKSAGLLAYADGRLYHTNNNHEWCLIQSSVI